MNNPVIMHINYCEQGQTFPELCRKAAGWGFDGIEFRGARAGVKESPEEYLDLITHSVKEAGLKFALFGHPLSDFTMPEAAARAEEAARSARFYRLAKERLGARFVVSNCFAGGLFNPDKSVPHSLYDKHGSGCASPEQWEWAVEGYRAIAREVEPLGVRLAFETHMNYLHDTVKAARQLADRIGSRAVGVNIDYVNQVYFPTFPTLAEAVAQAGDRLYYVHLKNCISVPGAGKFPTALEDGEVNNREFLRLLKDSGFSGPICVEAPRPGDREWFARQDLAYVRSVMKDL